MDFGFSDEQEQLKAQVRRFLDSECPLERVRQVMSGKDAYDRGLWNSVAELGWQALTVPEHYGGLGLAWEDLVVVAEEMGRTLFPSPLLTTAVAARAIALLGNDHQKSRWLPGIAAGEIVATMAVLEESDDLSEAGVELIAEAGGEQIVLTGKKMFVPYGQAAGLILVAAREKNGISLFAVPADAAGVRIVPQKLIDMTSRAAEIAFDGVVVDAADRLGEQGAAWPDIAAVIDAGTVVLAAEMVGAADASCKLATEYAKIRKQFGQPIGKFQGVKHHLAEIFVDIESSRSLVYFASWAVDHLPDARGHVSMAKAFASQALDRAGEECIQIHGAIGYTWECDAHLYYKRGRYCRNLAGSPEYHHERLLAVQGL